MKEMTQAMAGSAGSEYPVVKQVSLDQRDVEDLARLAREWHCSEAAAIRRAIYEKAQEAAPRPARRRLGSEELRQAVEAARAYYASDPEVREWAEFAGDRPSYDKG
jgi:hypothetical protein